MVTDQSSGHGAHVVGYPYVSLLYHNDQRWLLVKAPEAYRYHIPTIVWYEVTLSISVGVKKYSASCVGGGMLQIRCAVGGMEYENCA